MARGKGTANLAASLEVLAGAPLDARDVCPTVADLYVAANWSYKYIGMKTTVQATGDTYRLVNLDVTQESSWVLDGGSGGQTIQVDTMPTASVDELGNIYQYIGATDSTYTNGYFYRCVYENSAYSWVQHNVQPHDTPTQELTSAELAEVKAAFDPTGSSVGGLPILFDEGGIERQVGWYRYSNGTKKPVYEKCFVDTIEVQTDGVVRDRSVDITDTNIELLVTKGGQFSSTDGVYQMGIPYVVPSADYTYFVDAYVNTSTKKLVIQSNRLSYNNRPIKVAIRYTKTTDTPA